MSGTAAAAAAADDKRFFFFFFLLVLLLLLRARRPLLPRPLRQEAPLPDPSQGRRGPASSPSWPPDGASGSRPRSLAAAPDLGGGGAAAHAAWALGLDAGLALA